MREPPRKLTLDQWDQRYVVLKASGLVEPNYGGPLRRHVVDGDSRLMRLALDNSAASLRLWNFLLSEKERLFAAQASGKRIVGTMKDLGTVPVMAYALPNLVAFYPDGAWWIPCIMERHTRLFETADALGVDDSFCPVRAMLGAFLGGESHFPLPGLLTCSIGATCDDLSAIAQRLEAAGHPITWWEIPHRRAPVSGEAAVDLPGGFRAPQSQVDFVRGELARVKEALEAYAGQPLCDGSLAAGIARANRVRGLLTRLREAVYRAPVAPLPALEMLIAEMLAIHFCSDQAETVAVLEQLIEEVDARAACGRGIAASDAARIYWVNPVADLRAMNLLEDTGGRLSGAENLFCHALNPIPEDVPPMEALARTALADPLVGSSSERGEYIVGEIERFRAEAVVVSRIPGASHCAWEGRAIGDVVRQRLGIPVVEIEVPSICDATGPSLQTRLEALVETVRSRRRS